MGRFEDEIDRQLEAGMVKAIQREWPGMTEEAIRFVLFDCPFCGQRNKGHDQAACDAKMAAWKPTGLSGFLEQ